MPDWLMILVPTALLLYLVQYPEKAQQFFDWCAGLLSALAGAIPRLTNRGCQYLPGSIDRLASPNRRASIGPLEAPFHRLWQ
jgi:hypothetical protein